MAVLGRKVSEWFAAACAQSYTIVAADGVERQTEHHGISCDRLEVDEIALEGRQLLAVRRRLIGEQLLYVDLDPTVDRCQAAPTLGAGRGSDSSRDEDAVHDGFEPQVESDLGAGGHSDQFELPTARRCHGALNNTHGPGTAAQLARIEHEGRTRVEVRRMAGSGHHGESSHGRRREIDRRVYWAQRAPSEF